MRRVSSEGSLLDLDVLPWKRMTQNDPNSERNWKSDICTPQMEEDELEGRSAGSPMRELTSVGPGKEGKRELTKEHSVSVESLNQLEKVNKSLVRKFVINESCRAYSDSQLAPGAKGSTESMERNDVALPSPASFPKPFLLPPQHSHDHKPKLSSAKLHFKSLFGQGTHSFNPSLFNKERKDHATERWSRLHFMHQWSQVSHNRKRKITREELKEWATSLTALLVSETGVSVFGAFLRSEFSEENLQFYLACEQYRHSSNNFSLKRRAKDICDTYIQSGAPREVNLDSKTRDLTIQLLQAPSHTSLSRAQKCIYLLLDTDCYPRFLQSAIYLSLLQEAD